MRNNFWSPNDPEKKAREKQKKLEYSCILQQQIEEKKKQKEIEKKKAIEEELRYQARFYTNNNNSYSHTNLNTNSNNNSNTTPVLPQDNNDLNAKTLDLKPKLNFPLISPYTVNNNNSQSNYPYSNSKNNSNSKEAITLDYVEDLFKMFVEEQIKVINNYERDLDISIALEQFGHLAKKNKEKAIEKIHSEKEKLKTKLGFFPLEYDYNLKIEQLFDKILARKVNAINNNRSIDNDSINQHDANDYKNDKDKDRGKEYEAYANYNNSDYDNQIPSAIQQSLVGFSKLVVYNTDNNKDDNENFLVTWRDNIIKQQSSRKDMRPKTSQCKVKEEHKIETINDIDNNNNGVMLPLLQTEANMKGNRTNNKRRLSPIELDKEIANVKHKTIIMSKYSNALIQKYEYQNKTNTIPNANSNACANTLIDALNKRTIPANEIVSFNNGHHNKESENNNNNKANYHDNAIGNKDKGNDYISNINPLLSFNANDNDETNKQINTINIDNKGKKEVSNKDPVSQEEIEEDIPELIDVNETDDKKRDDNIIDKDKGENDVDRIITPQPKLRNSNRIKSRYTCKLLTETKPNKINPFQNSKEIEKLNAIVNNEIDITDSDDINTPSPQHKTHHKRQNSYQRPPPQSLPLRNIASASNRKANNSFHKGDNREKQAPVSMSMSKLKSSNKSKHLVPKANINYRDSQPHSENDSILNELDKFREMALNDIGSADLGNSQLSINKRKTKGIDLIPKDIIRNYSNVISAGVSNNNNYY